MRPALVCLSMFNNRCQQFLFVWLSDEIAVIIKWMKKIDFRLVCIKCVWKELRLCPILWKLRASYDSDSSLKPCPPIVTVASPAFHCPHGVNNIIYQKFTVFFKENGSSILHTSKEKEVSHCRLKCRLLLGDLGSCSQHKLMLALPQGGCSRPEQVFL